MCAEPQIRHQHLDVAEGRVELDINLNRHEVTLLEVLPVQDKSPQWTDDTRILGSRPL